MDWMSGNDWLIVANRDMPTGDLFRAAQCAGCAVSLLSSWEQVDELSIEADGTTRLIVDRREIEPATRIFFLSSPRLASEHSASDRDFLEAEWRSALISLMVLRNASLVNGSELLPQLGVHDVLPDLWRDCRMEEWNFRFQPSHEARQLWLLLRGGRDFCYPSDNYLPAVDHYLPRLRASAEAFRCIRRLDFLALSIRFDLERAYIDRAMISPVDPFPAQLMKNLFV